MAKITSKADFFKTVSAGGSVHEVRVGDDVFYLREMTAKARSAFDLTLDKKKNPRALEQLRERLLIATVSDDKGELIFTPDDAPQLREVLVGRIEPLFNEAARINGMSQRDIEDFRKNSETTQEPA